MDTNETPVVETPVAPLPEASAEVKDLVKQEIKAAEPQGPAHDLRQAQALLAGGLFPGQMAPAVTDAFRAIGRMADKIELDYKHEQEVKAHLKEIKS